MKFENYQEMLEIPQGVTAKYHGDELSVSGKNGEIKRLFLSPTVKVGVTGKEIVFSVPVMRKKEKMQLGTYVSHVKNMLAGVQKNYVYKLKICSGHFPMNVAFTNGELIIKNFIGEKKPRILKVPKNVSVVVAGEVITVECNDVEFAGLIAGRIEKLASRSGYDKRVFQQGIYITEKPTR